MWQGSAHSIKLKRRLYLIIMQSIGNLYWAQAGLMSLDTLRHESFQARLKIFSVSQLTETQLISAPIRAKPACAVFRLIWETGGGEAKKGVRSLIIFPISTLKVTEIFQDIKTAVF